MPSAVKKKQTKPIGRLRVLIVDDEPALLEAVEDVLTAGQVDCDLITADSITAAELAISDEGQALDLLVADLNLPDGDGLSLLSTLRKHRPEAAAVVMTGDVTVDHAVAAFRGGAADFIAKPFTATQLLDRVRAALATRRATAKRTKKVDRLKLAVRRLNTARRTVSKKVDLLCNDLVDAYGDLSKQMEALRTSEAFRRCVGSAKDLEQLLCHAMDWLIRTAGYTNVGVWLADEEGLSQLGAYMKYTTPGDPTMTDALKRVVLPLAAADTFVQVDAQTLKAEFSPAEFSYFNKQTFMGVNCTYLGENLASIVLFRSAATPFTEDDADALRAIAPIFAVALASVVKATEDGNDDNGGEDDGPGDPDPFNGGPPHSDRYDSLGPADEPPRPQPNKGKGLRKPDPADWWKRGETPPF